MAKQADRQAENRARRRRSRGSQSSADWATLPNAAIGKFVCAITGEGRAVRLGYSRDGGSYAIGIYGDGDPYTEYARPSDDILALLDEIALDLTGEDHHIASITE